MESSTIRYYFKEITHCNMCGSDTSAHKVMGKRLNAAQGMFPRRKKGITTTVFRCRDCGLIYSNPQPIPFDIQDHYGVPAEDYWRPEYFEVNETYFHQEIVILKRLLDFKPGMKSLDLGAGLGKQLIALNKAGFDAHGAEPSKSFRAKAISEMGIAADKLKLGMIEEVEYPENHFDFISTQVVLEHVYDPALCLDRAMKWLKPGGVLHIEVPSADWLVGRMLNFAYRMQLTDHVSNISPMHEPYHLYEFTLRSFEKYAEQRGCKIDRHDHYVCETLLPQVFDGFLRPLMKHTKSGMEICVWLRKS